MKSGLRNRLITIDNGMDGIMAENASFPSGFESLMGKKNPCLLQQGSDQSEVYRAFMKKL